jgi:hypothetical protein
VTDGDGDTATAPIKVTLQNVNDAPTVVDSLATVSEEGLAGGIPDTSGTPSDLTDAAVYTGKVALGDADGDPLTVTLGAPTGTFTSGGVALTWEGAGTQTLVGKAGDAAVITISINNEGDYTVTLAKPLDHPVPGKEDVLTFAVPVSVSDGQATTFGNINLAVEDDSPKATPVVKHDHGALGQNTNLLLILDVSGSMNDPSGV